MADYTFGQAFTESLMRGSAEKQQREQFAATLAHQELRDKAEDAYKQLQMEKLNEQVKIEQQKANDSARYQHDSLAQDAMKTANARREGFLKNFVRYEPTPESEGVLKMIGGKSYSDSEASQTLNMQAGEVPSGTYIPMATDLAMKQILYAKAQQREDAEHYKKLVDAKEAFDSIKHPDVTTQTIEPAVPPGIVRQAIDKNGPALADATIRGIAPFARPFIETAKVLGVMFSSGKPAVVQEVPTTPGGDVDYINQRAEALGNLRMTTLVPAKSVAELTNRNAVIEPAFRAYKEEFEQLLAKTRGFIDPKQLNLSPLAIQMYDAAKTTGAQTTEKEKLMEMARKNAILIQTKKGDEEATKRYNDWIQKINSGEITMQDTRAFSE
jgi:hypothetical protein